MSALAGGSLVGGAALCGAVLCGAAAYAVRGPSSQVFGRSVYRGPRDYRAIALTFDDGPSESTPAVLEILNRHRAAATFFQCGANVRRLPNTAREVFSLGHQIGNHSDTHAPLYLSSAARIFAEFERAQRTIFDTVGTHPRFLRAPFGTRWFGFRDMQRRLGLTGAMWTVIGRDWTSDSSSVVSRVLRNVAPGAIVCLHDGRELTRKPNIETTIQALRQLVPELAARGFQLVTIADLLCPTN